MTQTSAYKSNGARIAVLCAIAFTALAGAAFAWLHGAGAAAAPEPAKLTGSIGGYGSIGPAVYLSGAKTSILRWPSSGGQANSDGSPAAGRPCTSVWLAAGAQTKQVIVAVGSSRLCY